MIMKCVQFSDGLGLQIKTNRPGKTSSRYLSTWSALGSLKQL